jgi:hypothetical protein
MKKITNVFRLLGIASICLGASTMNAQTSTKLLDLPFNGNANDISTNANTPTVNGATLTKDRYGKTNSAYYFDGNSNITFPDISAYNNLTEYTLSAWIKPERLDVMHSNNIISKVTPNRDFVLYVNYQSPFTAASQFYDGSYVVGNGTSTIPLNKWTLITSTWNGSEFKVYVNGKLESTTSTSAKSPSWTGKEFSIGSLSADKSFGFKGAIDDVAVYGKALSANEISALTSDKIIDLPFSGNAKDVSINNNTATVNGAELTYDRFGNANEAYHFNGNSNIIFPVIPQYNNLEAFTMSAWIKPNVLTTMHSNNIISKVTPSRDFVLYVNYDGQNTAGTHFASSAGGFQYTVGNGTSTIPTDKWTMITSSWDGSVWRVYVNGELESTSAPTTRKPDWTGGEFSIGSLSADISYGFTGDIDDVVIYKRLLADNEVAEMYLPASEKILDLPFTGNATDISVNANTASINGATLTEDRFGNADKAYYFDGDANITFPVIPQYNNLDAFTLSAWINPTTLSKVSSNNIISKVTPNRDFVLYINHDGNKTAGTHFASSTGGFQYTVGNGASTIPVNKWSMITSTWDGSVWKVYVNGVLESTSTPTTRKPDWTGGEFSIGSLSADKSYGFTGSIDEVSIFASALSDKEIKSIYKPSDKIVGVFNTNTIESAIIAPNPTTSTLNISNSYSQGFIFNSAGNLVQNLNGENQIDVNTLETGYYIISLQTENGILTSSFIKE